MYEGFVFFDEYTESWKVHLVKNLLEENGIRVILDNSNMASMFSIPAFSERIFVHKEDLEQAINLLKESEINEEIDFDKLDDLAARTKSETAMYQSVAKSEVKVKLKMSHNAMLFFAVNYILLILQVAARVAVLNDRVYIEIFRYFLPLNILIAIVHIFYVIYLKTGVKPVNRSEESEVDSNIE